MHEFLFTIPQNKTLLFYLLLAVALLLSRIPLIGKYFRSVNTMIHEAGHAFITLLVSGEVIAVNLFADTSGNTVTRAKSRFLQILIASAGYPASSGTGFIFMVLLFKGYQVQILFVLVSLTLLLMVLSIRNTYGLFWAGTFSLINLLLIYFNDATGIYLAATFFTLIILTDSVFSSLDLLILSIKTPKKAGDAANLQKFTKLPAVIWALVFVSFSVFLVYLAIKQYFPPIHGILS